MSRTLSAATIKAMYSTESNAVLIVLLKIDKDTTIGMSQDIYLADNYTNRITETSEDVTYGVTSNSINYNFIPMEIVLPNDDNASAPRCTIAIHDVTRYLIPYLRNLTGAPSVSLSLVLSTTPNVVEATFTGFKLTNISYNANTISAELTMPSLEVEPFPAYTFTPQYFPGLF
jgi:hypothetical protein